MKKISLFCMLGLLLGVSCSEEKVKPPAMTDDTVAVFGDDAFGVFCLRTYDRNGDGVLTVGEIKNVVSLDFDDKDIRSLDGIEYFTGLQSLYCNQSAGGNLVRLDVSRNAELRTLCCAGNKLEELVVDGLRNLSRVDCAANNLEKLDLQNLPVLTFLLCLNNRLRNLDFSETPGLKSIDCANNGISALDVRPCGDITMIWCEGNAGMRISLDWRQAPGIFGDDDVVLEVAGDENLVFADAAVEGALAARNFDKNGDGRISRHEAVYVRELFDTDCSGFESLSDFSYLINLYWCELVCADKGACKLCSLDSFARNGLLYNLDLRNLPVATVDLSRYPALKYVRMSGCDVEELDVSGLQYLESLVCDNSPVLKTVFFRNSAQYDRMSWINLDKHILIRFKESD